VAAAPIRYPIVGRRIATASQAHKHLNIIQIITLVAIF
jgi:ATP adenylyltransferase/5',5'''-P-1,P-4-tetraphosphate phosphorylase II